MIDPNAVSSVECRSTLIHLSWTLSLAPIWVRIQTLDQKREDEPSIFPSKYL